MNILAIDTTTKIASVSVLKNDKIYTNYIDNEITHSEKLLPLIDTTLKNANLKLNDITNFACINGPGSFTGIRIGLSTLKAFSQVQRQDIFSISSLSLIAYCTYNLQNLMEIYCINIIDARNDRVYYSMSKIYKNENNKIIIDEIFKTSNDLIDDAISSLRNYISNINIDKNLIYISGNAIIKFKDKLEIISNNTNDFYPTTQDLIYAVQNIDNINDYTYNAFSLDAMYARPSQAERIQKND